MAARARQAAKQSLEGQRPGRGSKETSDSAATDGLLNLFLVIAVAVALAVGGLSYLSGSSPEWVAFKSSISLVGVGLVGWVISTLVSAGLAEALDDSRGTNVDLTLPQTTPVSTRSDDVTTADSATR